MSAGYRARHARPARRRGRRAAAAGALALLGAALLPGAQSAWAAAPDKDGWWSAANTGAVAPPAPPDVPAGGLYVESGFSGPVAISALSFTIPTGASVGNLTLTTAGQPVITAPPLACLIPTKAQGYTATQNGAWASAPAYDCSAGQVTATVSSDQKTVTFAVAKLVRSGTLAVAILAGGNADRIPFNAPDATTLTVTGGTSGASSVVPTAPSGGGGAYAGAGQASAPASTGTGTGTAPAAGSGAGGLAPTGPAGGVAPPSAPTVAAAPAGPGQAPVNAPASTATTTSGRPAAAGSSTGSSHRVATAVGLTAMVLALVLWAEGFGVLGGRVGTLAARRRPPPYPAEALSGEPAASARS